jgi:trimethylamine--corrinoid protein Co-methyltransferase
MSETRARRSRSGGGAARRAERTAVSVETERYIERNIPLYEFLDEATLEIIEYNAETVLEEIGVNFVDSPVALERWRSVGAIIEGERVRIPRGLARELCKTAPSKFVQHARNPERSVEIGGKSLVTAPVYGPPFVRDRDGGRRYATLADFQKFVKLGYMSKYLHHSGGTVCEPTDVPVNKRHLDMLLAHMVYSDKPFMGSVTEPSRAQDSVDMCEILFGKDFVQNNTCDDLADQYQQPAHLRQHHDGGLRGFCLQQSSQHHFALHRGGRDGACVGCGDIDPGFGGSFGRYCL